MQWYKLDKINAGHVSPLVLNTAHGNLALNINLHPFEISFSIVQNLYNQISNKIMEVVGRNISEFFKSPSQPNFKVNPRKGLFEKENDFSEAKLDTIYAILCQI